MELLHFLLSFELSSQIFAYVYNVITCLGEFGDGADCIDSKAQDEHNGLRIGDNIKHVVLASSNLCNED